MPMRLATLSSALLALVAACGGRSAPATVGATGGASAPRGPAMVFVAVGEGAMAEVACHQCDGLRAGLRGQEVSSGAARFRITGTVSDGCDASGPTDVTAFEPVTGGDAELDIAVLPAGATIDLELHSTEPDTTPVDPRLRAAIALRAAADAAGKAPGAISPETLVIEQVLSVNVAGDGRPETLVSANVPLSDEDGPGYMWSGLVMVPPGDLDGAVTLWQSDLEQLVIDASFDLDGDGVRELVFSASYYEGGGRGAAVVSGGSLQILDSWGCGA